MAPPEYGEFGRCEATAKSTGEQCGQPAIGDHGKCYFHGAGGGPPDNNGNATTHNLAANRGKLYHRLSEDKQREVDQLEHALIERYREFHGRDPDPMDAKDLFELAMGPIQREFGRDYMAEQWDESGNPLLKHITMMTDAGPVEFDKPNEILDTIGDNRREDRLMKKHMGLFRDPETKQAESMRSIADILSEDD